MHRVGSSSEDGDVAWQWLQGTEVDRLSARKESRREAPSHATVRRYFDEMVAPLCIGLTELSTNPPTFVGLIRAYALVCSRAFVTDLYHGLCMVPIADAFNHHMQNHVHLEVEDTVCPHCGSQEICAHDSDDEENAPSDLDISSYPNAANEGTFEMVTNTLVPPTTEVFNTYGETLSNAELLLSYGFLLDQNDNDHLSWEITDPDLLDEPKSEVLRDLYINIYDAIPQGTLDAFEESELVEHTSDKLSALSISGEGKISSRLWLLLAVQSLLLGEVTAGDVKAILDRIPSMIEAQLDLEAQTSDEDEDAMDEVLQDSQVMHIPRLVLALCQRRRASYRGGGIYTLEELGIELDNLPETWTRTRSAMTLLIGERSILDSCEAAWSDLVTSISD